MRDQFELFCELTEEIVRSETDGEPLSYKLPSL